MAKKLTWTTEKRKISDLVPNPKNPRRLTDKQKTDLQKSIEKFDLVEIPAINADGTILAGHQRLKIMAALGRAKETIDVRVPSRKLTKAEEREYNIRSNRNTGEWDFELLAEEFEMGDLVEWGFSEDELTEGWDDGPAAGNTDPDDVPEPPEEPVTKPGDFVGTWRSSGALR